MNKSILAAIGAVAVCGSALAADGISSSIVGYQNRGFDRAKFSYVTPTFLKFGNGRTLALGDIEASDNFYQSSIQFLTDGGATAKVEHKELGLVYAIYKFQWAEDTAAGVRGWYFSADKKGLYPQNDRVIKAGEAFCVDLNSNEKTAALTFAGEVDAEDNIIAFDHSKFNYVGNATPVDLVLGDIDASDNFFQSSIQFLTEGGATAKVDHGKLGLVYATYKFQWAEDTAAKVRGWYFSADKQGLYPQNDRVIKAGEAFCVDLNSNEKTATITIPAALK